MCFSINILSVAKILLTFCFRLFADEINWGRVAALMCLAYRITMTVVKEKAKKFAQFMKVIVSHVVRFIKEKIAGWIASQGGWVSDQILRMLYSMLFLTQF